MINEIEYKNHNFDEYEIEDIHLYDNGNKWIASVKKSSDEKYILTSEGGKYGSFEDVCLPYFPINEKEWIAGVKKNDFLYVLTRKDFTKVSNEYEEFSKIDFYPDYNNWIAEVRKDKHEFRFITSGGKEFKNYYTFYFPVFKSFVRGGEESVERNRFCILKCGKIKEIEKIKNLYKEYHVIDFHINFSSDCKRWIATIGTSEESYVLLSDGRKIGPFSGSFSPEISSDGTRWAVGVEKEEDEGYFILTSEGEEIGPFDDILYVDLSSDGSKWVAQTESYDDWYMVTNGGKRIGPYEFVDPFLIENSNVWIAFVYKNHKVYVLTSDGVKKGPYKFTQYFDFSYKNSEWRWLLWVKEDKKYFIYTSGGREIKINYDLKYIKLAENSKSFYIVYLKNNHIVVREEEI